MRTGGIPPPAAGKNLGRRASGRPEGGSGHSVQGDPGVGALDVGDEKGLGGVENSGA